MTPPATTAGVLETERLRLRGFTDTEADAQLLFELDSDPEVMRYIGPYGLPTVEAYQERIRTVWLPYYATGWPRGFWAVTEKATDQFLGWFVLRPATDYKFRGVATEAATMLVPPALADPGVTCVVAAALVPNRASTRVMENAGLSRVREFDVAGLADPLVTYARCRAGCSPA
jgi:RimJ/RimL family protein N-acetyltransferase